MTQRNVYMRNFPVIGVKAAEGTLTRYTNSVAPTGGINEGAAVYSVPLQVGDLVKIKDHTTNGLILVEKATAGNESDFAHGIVVSAPTGIDNTTVSGQTPAAAQRRIVDVAFFGLGVIELTASATSAVAPGDSLALDENEDNEVEPDVAYASITKADNGSMIALSYAASGSKVSVLVGAACAFPSD